MIIKTGKVMSFAFLVQMFLLKSEKRTSAEILNIPGSVDISFEPDDWTNRMNYEKQQIKKTKLLQ